MGRGGTSNAFTNVGIGRQMSQNLSGQAAGTFGTVNPLLTEEATNPQGFAPSDLAAVNTASQQSLGGANAAAAGEGALSQARTRNAGAANPAIEESARGAMRQGSQNAMQTQWLNAQQREKNRQAGIGGLQGLYGTDLTAALNALGLSTNAINAATGASAQTTGTWLPIVNQLISNAKQGPAGQS